MKLTALINDTLSTGPGRGEDFRCRIIGDAVQIVPRNVEPRTALPANFEGSRRAPSHAHRHAGARRDDLSAIPRLRLPMPPSLVPAVN